MRYDKEYGKVYRDPIDGETLMVISRADSIVQGLVVVVRDNFPMRNLGDVGDIGTVVSRNVDAWERLGG